MAYVARDAMKEAFRSVQQQIGPRHGQHQVGPTSEPLVRTHSQPEVDQMVEIYEERDQKPLKEFMRYKPSSFFGKVDPLLAEDWMWKTKKIHDMIRGRIDEDRIWLATNLFESDADQWGRDMKNKADLTGMTWADFEAGTKMIPQCFKWRLPWRIMQPPWRILWPP